jgi:hypothetical protein
VAIDTSDTLHYTDHPGADGLSHRYQVRAFNRACGMSALTAAVTGDVLPLAVLHTEVPETLECDLPYSAEFTHCSGVTVDSLFLSLNGDPYQYLIRYTPVLDVIQFTVPRGLLHQNTTEHCRLQMRSDRGLRVDTLETPTFVVQCPLSAVEEIPGDIPRDFFLDQNYPNPFNPQTQIRFGVPTTAEVTLEVFDIMGRKVETLEADRMNPGVYTYTWVCAHCPTGMYLIRMQTGNRVLLTKTLLMK